MRASGRSTDGTLQTRSLRERGGSVKPLIIALDIVEFSLNQQGELKQQVEEMFAFLYRLGEGSKTFHVLSRGDGAILVWNWNVASRTPPSSKHAAGCISAVLDTLHKWRNQTGQQLRVGVHAEFLEPITINSAQSVFGQGISECVRVMTAADPDQALASEAAYEHFQLRQHPEVIRVAQSFSFYDKHGVKHVARPITLPGGDHWSSYRPVSAREGVIDAVVRKEEEEGSNLVLQQASFIRFIGMTYKSLGESFTKVQRPLRLERLERAVLCLYSLPSQRRSHPLLKDANALEREWLVGVENTINGLLDSEKCPKLDHLDLILLSVPPSFTGTMATISNDGHDADYTQMRFHPVIDGFEPKDLPTLISHKTGSDCSSLVNAFRLLLTEVGRRPDRLIFPLKRPNYTRASIRDCLQLLKSVCNHKDYGPDDILYSACFQSNTQGDRPCKMSPEQVALQLPNHRRTNTLAVSCDFDGAQLHLSLRGCDKAGPVGIIHGIENDHYFACFCLLTWDGTVVLIDYPKPGWDYDVPGGKSATLDRNGVDTVRREVFEELGLILDRDRLGAPLGSLYDHKSAREQGLPVVAQYYHYPLKDYEYSYLSDVARTTTKGHPLVHVNLTELLREKREHQGAIEARCHAPLAVIDHIVKNLTSNQDPSGAR